jgi:hypothetical protein
MSLFAIYIQYGYTIRLNEKIISNNDSFKKDIVIITKRAVKNERNKCVESSIDGYSDRRIIDELYRGGWVENNGI